MSVGFEWDATKARLNIRKHRVSFDEALTVFEDPLARIFDDPDHSYSEHREIIIGYSVNERLLLVSFQEKGNRIRIISARPVTRKERSDYEENVSK